MTLGERVLESSHSVDMPRFSQALRPALWMLHVWVVLLAVASVFTTRFDLWIDVRALRAGGTALEYLWATSAILVPFLSGPRLAGIFGKCRWAPGIAPRLARILLWPTYALIICLLADTVYFAHLFFLHLADLQIPLPFLMGVLLAAWTLLTRQWLRTSESIPSAHAAATTAIPLKFRLLATTYAAATALFMAGAFALHLFQLPPPPDQPIDLAVVLGGYVLPDSTASVELRDRTLVAINLYNQHIVHHILLSGGIHDPKKKGDPERNEITAMKHVCLENGVPEDALFYDPVGINTRATAFNTALLMKQNGFSSVIVCSTDFHLYRTVMSFHQAGVSAFALPARPVGWQCAEIRDTVRELCAIAGYSLFPDYHKPTVARMQLSSPHIIVTKSAGTLELFDGPQLVKTYTCITGGNPGQKEKEGDRRTPEGTYRIVYKNPESNYHLSLGLDYPNQQDAARGLAQNAINQSQYETILASLKSDLTRTENQKNLWYTPLGGEIFVHGHGTGRPDTAGCVALDNTDIEELYAIIPVGTPIEIRP